MLNRAANSRPARPLAVGARARSAAVAGANRAAALAAGSREVANARERALFLGAASPEAPGAPGAQAPSAAAARARRRSAAARLGSKSLAVLMAVILAVGLMPLPAFGDGGVVVNGQRVVAATAASLTTVDADGNVTTESSEATLGSDGTVTVDGRRVPALDSTAESLALYRLNRLTAGSATIADLKGYSSASGLSPAAGIAAAAQRAEDEAAAALGAEDAAVDGRIASDPELAEQLAGMDFSTRRVVVALSDGASLQERDLGCVASEGSGLYVLQYGDEDSARRAYVRYLDREGVLFAAPDSAVVAADSAAGSADGLSGSNGNDNGSGGSAGAAGDPDGGSGSGGDGSGSGDGDGAGIEGPGTDAPVADLGSLEDGQQALAEDAERRESEDATAPAAQRPALVALIDTAVPSDFIDRWNEGGHSAELVGRVSAIGEDQPDLKTTDEGYEPSHGAKMLAAILEANPDARVLSIEALDDTGYGSAATVYAALALATAARADVYSMSFAGYAVAGNEAIEAGVEEALQAASDQEREVALLAAAGNQGADARFFVPASYDGVDAVGALDPAKLASAAAGEAKADPQAYRQASSNYGDAVDLWVPGESTSFAAATAAGALSDLFNSISPDNRMPALQSVLLAGAGSGQGAGASDDGQGDGGGDASGSGSDGSGGQDNDSDGADADGSDADDGAADDNADAADADGQDADGSGSDSVGGPDATNAADGSGDAAGPSGASAGGALASAYGAVRKAGEEAGVWAAAVNLGESTGDVRFDANGSTPGAGSVQDAYVTKTGLYRLQLYGAQGGSALRSTSNSAVYLAGAAGGYTDAYVILRAGTHLAVAVGKQGKTGFTATNSNARAEGGWNGGGRGSVNYRTSEPDDFYASTTGGGGATHIAISSVNGGKSAESASKTLASYGNETTAAGYVLAVAGGGGGAGSDSGSNYGPHSSAGGRGGALTGEDGKATSGKKASNYKNDDAYGRGATQQGAGANGAAFSGWTSNSTDASFGQGGSRGWWDIGGGGGGWFGGGAAGHWDHVYGSAGGGGGSSHLGGVLGNTTASTGTVPGTSTDTKMKYNDSASYSAKVNGTARTSSMTQGGNTSGNGYAIVNLVTAGDTVVTYYNRAGTSVLEYGVQNASGFQFRSASALGLDKTITSGGATLSFVGWAKTANASAADFPVSYTGTTSTAGAPADGTKLYPAYASTATVNPYPGVDVPYAANGSSANQGSIQDVTISQTGLYRLQLYGAQGGSTRTSTSNSAIYQAGAGGGYTDAYVILKAGTHLAVAVGKTGNNRLVYENNEGTPGGWNGGGNASTKYITRTYSSSDKIPDDCAGSGAGGGATHIAISSKSGGQAAETSYGTLASYSNRETAANYVLAVAGGGGGAASQSNSSYRASGTDGKATGGLGGGMAGGDGGHKNAKSTDANSNAVSIGHGGTQTTGGAKGTSLNTAYSGNSSNGGFGTGGNAAQWTAGGGGGGWYGGGGAGHYDNAYGTAGGGGGSGHLGAVLGNTTASLGAVKGNSTLGEVQANTTTGYGTGYKAMVNGTNYTSTMTSGRNTGGNGSASITPVAVGRTVVTYYSSDNSTVLGYSVGSDNITLTPGSTLGVPATKTINSKSCQFIGWSTSKSNRVEVRANSTTSNAVLSTTATEVSLYPVYGSMTQYSVGGSSPVTITWTGAHVVLSEVDALALSGSTATTAAENGKVFVGWTISGDTSGTVLTPGTSVATTHDKTLVPVYSEGPEHDAATPVPEGADAAYSAVRDNSGATGAIAMRLVGSSFLRVGCKPGAIRVQVGCKPTRADEAPTLPTPARRADPRISVQNPQKRASFRDKRAFSGVLHGKRGVGGREGAPIRMQNPQKRAAPPRTCAFRAVLHANPRVGPGAPGPGAEFWPLGGRGEHPAGAHPTSNRVSESRRTRAPRPLIPRRGGRACASYPFAAVRAPEGAGATRRARRTTQPDRQARRAETRGTARRARHTTQPAGRRRRTRSISSASKSATGNTPKAPRARGAGGTLKGRIA